MYIEKLKDMFEKMVINKDASLIPQFYHPDFLLYTNEQTTDYVAFMKSHQDYYSTPIQYQVSYDEETLLEQGEKVAGRIWITITTPDEGPKRIEVILIAHYKDNKIYRLWELTYPDWSKMSEFNE